MSEDTATSIEVSEPEALIGRGKKNFRAENAEWAAGIRKTQAMRRDGYPIDMTVVMEWALRQFIGETPGESAKRLGITKGDSPIPHEWRNPHGRPVASR